MFTLTLTYYKDLCVTGKKYYKTPDQTFLWLCWQILIDQFQIQLARLHWRSPSDVTLPPSV